MTTSYDLAVIGTGTAASVAAERCGSAGWRVALVDHQPFGGTCALRGCDPKKVLAGDLAIRNGLTAEDLRSAIFAYPTGASDIAYMR